MGKYGTNYTGFGAYEGGVNADKGAPLVATNSDGETALLFGPAALREIQAGVANGDFAIPPDDAGGTITESNPLPYWTFTDVNSAGAITCAIVADATAGSSNVLRWSVAANTATDKSATLTRFVPVPATKDQAYAAWPALALGAGTSTALRSISLTMQFYKQDQTTTTGTSITKSKTFQNVTSGVKNIWFDVTPERCSIPSDAAFAKLTITVSTTGTLASIATVDLYEARMTLGAPASLLADLYGTTYGPGALWKQYNSLFLAVNPPTLDTVTGGGMLQITDAGTILYGSSEVQGYNKQGGSVLSQYDKAGSADSTTITTAGTYYALTNAEVSFTPQFVGQRWLLTFTGYASLNTTVIQYCFVRANVTDSSNGIIGSDLGFTRADNFGTSGRGATVAFTKVWTADAAAARKFKLYGTVQTTNGLVLSLAYTQMTAYPIG